MFTRIAPTKFPRTEFQYYQTPYGQHVLLDSAGYIAIGKTREEANETLWQQIFENEWQKGSILSDKDIVKEYKEGNIMIEPFDESHLGNCSYDVMLGENFYRQNLAITERNPWTDPAESFWIPGETEYRNGEKVILLRPQETILAHTMEEIGGTTFITTMMKSRSSLMRNCISVCIDAGWGDVGYTSKWTLEITNHALNATMVLPVGERVGQLVFLYTSSIPSHAYDGKYQDKTKEWEPSNMLPRLNLDK